MYYYYSVLLIYIIIGNTAFATQDNNSTREFLNYNRSSYNTEGHPKAKGIGFTIEYPNSWRAVEGARPNIVQKFVSERGKVFETAMIITKALPGLEEMNFTITEREELLFSIPPDELIPPGGAFIKLNQI